MFEELNTPADVAAKRLLGCELIRKVDGEILRARIVETEAYDQDDPGSHTFRGRTPRNEIMFGPAGFFYVYFIYGMHHCCNIVTGPDGHGEAALIRAVEPLQGVDTMRRLRNGHAGKTLTNGPAKLCYALDITKELNAHDASKPPLQLIMNPSLAENKIFSTTRVGLKSGIDTPWRFYIRDNKYISGS